VNPVSRGAELTSQQVNFLYRHLRAFFGQQVQGTDEPELADRLLQKQYPVEATTSEQWRHLQQALGHFRVLDCLSPRGSTLPERPGASFVRYVRDQVELVSVLSQSFKPIWCIHAPLGLRPLSGFLSRLKYWHHRRVRHCYLFDEDQAAGGGSGGIQPFSPGVLVRELRQYGTDHRFKVLLLQQAAEWLLFLVDLKGKTLEVLDLSGTHFPDGWNTEMTLFTPAQQEFLEFRRSFPQFQFKRVTRPNTPAHQAPTWSGLACLGYLVARVAFLESPAVATRAVRGSLKKLLGHRHHFFRCIATSSVLDQEDPEVSRAALRPEAQDDLDVRLATRILLNFVAPFHESHPGLQELSDQLGDGLTNPQVSYTYLARLSQALEALAQPHWSESFRWHVGDRLWSALVSEVQQDPLTLHWRAQKAPVRLKEGVGLWQGLLQRAQQLNAGEQQREVSEAKHSGEAPTLSEWSRLVTLEVVPQWQGWARLVPKVARLPDDFGELLRLLLQHKAGVSAATWLLRSADAHLVALYHTPGHPVLHQRFPAQYRVFNPVLETQKEELKSKHHDCHEVLSQARDLLDRLNLVGTPGGDILERLREAEDFRPGAPYHFPLALEVVNSSHFLEVAQIPQEYRQYLLPRASEFTLLVQQPLFLARVQRAYDEVGELLKVHDIYLSVAVASFLTLLSAAQHLPVHHAWLCSHLSPKLQPLVPEDKPELSLEQVCNFEYDERLQEAVQALQGTVQHLHEQETAQTT